MQTKRENFLKIKSRAGHVRITYRRGTFVQPLMQWKSNKFKYFETVFCILMYMAKIIAFRISTNAPTKRRAPSLLQLVTNKAQ